MTDFDGDGMLDLILSHGESMAQPISIFKGTQVSQAGGFCIIPNPSTSPCSVSLLLPPLQGTNNNWLRVIPRTRFGAFARGAKVVLFTRRSGAHLRIIDGGSGYLCEMEPVAHFGLGEQGAATTSSLPPCSGARSAAAVPCGMVVTYDHWFMCTLWATALCMGRQHGHLGQGQALPLHPYHPLASFQPLPAPETPPLTGCPPAGHDKPSSLEVTWPDGRVVSRAVASSETNSVLEVPYPLDTEEPLVPAPLEVRASCVCRVGGSGGRLGSAGSVAAAQG